MEDLEYSMVSPSKKIVSWLKENIGIKEIEIKLLQSGGSTRSYHRLISEEGTWILQQSDPDSIDFQTFIDYAKVFSDNDLNTPRVLIADEEEHQLLQNDLGSNRLFEYSQLNIEEEEIYKDVINELIDWQELSPTFFEKLPQLEENHFNLEHLLWESNYFKENVLHKHLGYSREELIVIEPFMNDLAERVNKHPCGFVHRDFQSQNIMVSDLEPFFIDFQGARNGSQFYDIASLLWDPYVELDLDLTNSLFDYFLSQHPIFSKGNKDEYKQMFLDASLQRLMQACGAFCFLSKAKGKTTFEQWIEPGLKQLRIVAEIANANDLLKLIKI